MRLFGWPIREMKITIETVNAVSGPRPDTSPAPRVRSRGVLGLFDRPVYRDWIFWLVLFWVGLPILVFISSADSGKSAPIDGEVSVTIFLVVAFGILPAWIRSMIRKLVSRRRARLRAPDVSTEPLPPAPLPAEPIHIAPLTFPSMSPVSVPPATDRNVGFARPAAMRPVMPAHESTGLLPYPIASVLREFRQAQDERDQYDTMLKLAEALAVTICVTVAAVLRSGLNSLDDSEQQCARKKALKSLNSALVGKSATFGTWTSWLDALAHRSPGSIALSPDINDALRDDGNTPGLVTCLHTLRGERNRSAHGEAPQSLPEFGLRVSNAGPYLETALQKAAFLEQSPWLLTKSSDYRPRQDIFDVRAFFAMGDHPDFELRRYDFKVPLGTDMFYILNNGEALPLSPLVARRYCLACQSLEVCYVTRVHRDSGAASLRSFHRGHEVSDPELGEEVKDYA